MIDLIIPTLSQGLLWSLLALGVYITCLLYTSDAADE